jgi:hypothetical protein
VIAQVLRMIALVCVECKIVTSVACIAYVVAMNSYNDDKLHFDDTNAAAATATADAADAGCTHVTVHNGIVADDDDADERVHRAVVVVVVVVVGVG